MRAETERPIERETDTRCAAAVARGYRSVPKSTCVLLSVSTRSEGPGVGGQRGAEVKQVALAHLVLVALSPCRVPETRRR